MIGAISNRHPHGARRRPCEEARPATKPGSMPIRKSRRRPPLRATAGRLRRAFARRWTAGAGPSRRSVVGEQRASTPARAGAPSPQRQTIFTAGGWPVTLPHRQLAVEAQAEDKLAEEAIAAHTIYLRRREARGRGRRRRQGASLGWLSKRIGLTLVAPDLAGEGFELVGGRLLPAGRHGRTAAHGRQPHIGLRDGESARKRRERTGWRGRSERHLLAGQGLCLRHWLPAAGASRDVGGEGLPATAARCGHRVGLCRNAAKRQASPAANQFAADRSSLSAMRRQAPISQIEER